MEVEFRRRVMYERSSTPFLHCEFGSDMHPTCFWFETGILARDNIPGLCVYLEQEINQQSYTELFLEEGMH